MAKLNIGSQIHNIPNTGIQYSSDLSSTFTNRSLIDLGYLESRIGGNPLTISTISTNQQGISTNIARADHTHKVEINTNFLNLTNSVSTNSNTFVIIPGTTIDNLPSGNYIIIVFAYTNHSSNNSSWQLAVSFNFSTITQSITVLNRNNNLPASLFQPYFFSTVVNLTNTLNRIDLVWRVVTAGAITATNRSIMAVRIS